MKHLLAKLRDPVMTNRSIDLLSTLLWGCYAWWGLSSTLYGIPSIQQASTPLYELVWGAWIGTTAFVATIAAGSTLYRVPHVNRIIKKWVEIVALLVMLIAVTVYPSITIAKAIGGDPNYIAVSGIALSYLLFPIWRSVHLYGRIKTLKNLPLDDTLQ